MDKILSGVTNVLIDTGNVISVKELKQKASQSPTEELIESVYSTLQACISSADSGHCKENGQLILQNSSLATPITPEERKELKITVKIFLSTFDTLKLSEAINKVKLQLSVAVLDSLILAFPHSSSKLLLEDIQPLWKVLEQLVTSQKVITIGVSDLDTPLLKELYETAEIKPSVNQVNLESCCVMPPDMTSFAKEKDIQLLTHSDPKELLGEVSLQESLAPLNPFVDIFQWRPDWVARYSVFVKCRGIIQNKGYLLAAHRKRESD